MPRSVAAKEEAKTRTPTEIKAKETLSVRMKPPKKKQPTMVTPPSKKSGERKSPRRKVITGRRKNSTKFTSLKMAENWADALDGNLWIHDKAEKQIQTVPAVPKEIIILRPSNAN